MNNDPALPRTSAPFPPAPLTLPQVGSAGESLVRELLETLLPALLIALFSVMFIAQPTLVEGQSMAPTLHSGERLVVEKLSYHWRAPAHGEIVVFQLPQHPTLIKRVVAVPGDVVAIRQGVLYLNERPVAEPYLTEIGVDNLPSLLVPEGYLFVLGDNRNGSRDSRDFGMVPIDALVGRAVVRYWPLQTLGSVN